MCFSMPPGATAASNKIPAALHGFESVCRFWDARANTSSAKIQPGECYVTARDEMLVTVLGSCIAACIRDPVLGVGGMNHFMLPEQATGHAITRTSLNEPLLCYGNWAMEHLINSILKQGGKRERLEVKLFGGARVLANMVSTDVGQRNIEFIRSFLENDGIRVAAQDLGGDYPRKIIYFPHSGRARMKKLILNNSVGLISQEKAYLDRLKANSNISNVELF